MIKKFDLSVGFCAVCITLVNMPNIASVANSCLLAGVWDMRKAAISPDIYSALVTYDRFLTLFVLYFIGRCAYTHGFKNRQNKVSEVQR